MKSILISIKPKYVAEILNGNKTIEIRKTMPKCDLPIDVYIYCTKDTKGELHYSKEYGSFYDIYNSPEHYSENGNLNGKVVAKFTLNKVEEIRIGYGIGWETKTIKGTENIEKASCVSRYDLYKYCKGKGYAWHISNLEIFDRPKELSEFKPYNNGMPQYEFGLGTAYDRHLTKAPQSMCYVEEEQ